MESPTPLYPKLKLGNEISHLRDLFIGKEEEESVFKNDDDSESATSATALGRGESFTEGTGSISADSEVRISKLPAHGITGSSSGFPDTDPFDFAAAQHMISTATSGGAFLSYIAAGWLSSRIGQRRVILVNLLGSIVFTLAKYAARHDYWTFVAMAFVNGCFSSTWAVGLGYMAEVFLHDRFKGDTYLGHVNAVGVIGRSAGGLLAVINPNRLFFPLISVSVVSLSGLVMAYLFLADAREFNQQEEYEENENTEIHDLAVKTKSSNALPEKMDTITLFNVLFGAFVDYAGSMGLLSFSLSPLMFQTFHLNFVEDGLDPIVGEQTYRILYSMAAACIAAGAMISPWLFKKLGVAVSCVLANLVTGGFTIALLYIALIEPATKTTFAIYTTVLYVGYALSMVSGLSTGPMLDRITPLEKKVMVQAMNTAIADGTWAIFPILYALIVDIFGITVALWTCTGVCCLAALVNLPLVFHPLLQTEPQEKATIDRLDVTKRTANSGTNSLLMTSPSYSEEENEIDADDEFSC